MAQDGLQAAGTVTATTTGATSVAFPFRASCFQITSATSAGCFVDITGGTTVVASTSAGYPMAAGEKLPVPVAGSQPRMPAYYSGFSVLASSGTTATVRYIALR